MQSKAAVIALVLTTGCHASTTDAAGQTPATAPTSSSHQASNNSNSNSNNGSAEIESSSMKVMESGQGRNILVLHGGGGPFTMVPVVKHLSEKSHVIMPTYPGWDGTPRPESLDTVGKLADEITKFLNAHDLKDVTVVGSSLGGWVAAELALRDQAHRLSGLVIINGSGVDIPGQPITNVTGFTPPQLAQVAFFDPAKFLANLPPPTPERIAIMKGNEASLVVFASSTYCYDPTLLGRLKGIHVPTLVLWGEADHVVSKEYGRQYAAAIPKAQFATIEKAGHLPWAEQPEATFNVLDRFIESTGGAAK
jgi:pimeloyl-ACP methyl ester carboxylesterase